ncbi:hypothetical protein [Rhodococcus qingshengii]|uniref:hypothetical protein n=1 Tax=Rhodococcus qingshengii TaxID=334542 RepID=UPI0035DFD485
MNKNIVRCSFYLRTDDGEAYSYDELHNEEEGPSSLYTSTPPLINDDIYLHHREKETRLPYKVIKRSWSYPTPDGIELDIEYPSMAVIVIPSTGPFDPRIS